MPYYGDGAPYYYGGPFANHSSLMTGVGRTYHNPIAARYSPHLSTISETPFVVLRRYSPAAPITTTTTSLARPRRIIDTADIDVSKPPRSLAQDNRQQRHRLRRDRPTIKIRSQALKDNPALREYNEKHEKTVGELLVEKFLIKEKDKQSPEEEGRKMRLYHQASLMSNNLTKEQTLSDAERENDILAAIRRRVTRRMTRRKSSVGVVPLDPEQIEREAAFHAAQAEALDTLVAEEQAELEVEIRRGTFAKKQVMRLPVEISEVSETEDDEKDEEDRKDITLKKHTTTKKKKKKKIPQTPSPSKSDADEDDSFEIPESVIEEEEFEWDDREKCDDISKIVPLKDDEIVKKDLIRTLKSPVKVNEKEEKIDNKLKKIDIVLQNGENKIQKDVVKKQISAKPEIKEKQYKVDIKVADRKEKEKKVSTQDTLITEDKRVKVEKIEAKALKEEVKVVKNEEKSKTEEKKIRKEKVPELNQLKRTISAPQKEINETDETTPRFKVEACNSVGDFSTLFVKAANSPDENFKTIEQFRESIRLPAPRRLGAPKISNIETEVVLPVRKPYILDTSRNSVYLALKSSQNVRQGRIGADDRPSIIIDETRKESNSEGGDIASIDSRPAKSDVIVEDQSKPLRDSIISEERDALKISDDTVSESAKIEENFNVEFKQSENKSEAVIPLVNENFKKSKVRHKEEFVAWWDETEETPETESEKKSVKSETNDILEKSKEKIVESVKTEIEVVKKIEPEKKIENISDSAKTKVETKIKAVSVDEKIKNKVKTLPKTNLDKNIPNKISTLRDKSKEVVGVVDKSVETVLHENKQKADNKILNAKEKVTKSALEKEVKREEKLEQIDAQKKTEPLPKVSSEDEREKLTSAAKEITARAITLSSNKDESVSNPVINRMIPEQKRPSNDLTKLKCELPKLNRYLSNIPEEPKSTSPTEKEELFTNKSKTNDTSITSNNKSLFAKEETNFPVITKKIEHQPFIKPNLSPAVTVAKKEKDERKKKVDTKAVMKIEKKILEDAESPRKILTTAIPETQIIETAAFVPVIQKEDESSSPEKKVGLQPTKKKSSELAAAPGTEIDFWSEIKAQESVKVSGTPRKVQSRSDSPSVDLHITKNSEQSTKPPENLKLDLSKINRAVVDQEDVKTPLIPDEEELKTPLIKDQEELKTPLIPDHEEPKTPLILDEEEPKTPLIFDQEDPKTPLISDPSTPLIENQTELPTINIQSPEERISSAIQNGEVNKKNQEQQEEEPKTPTIESECSGTVKKISKWTNHDNLSNLNETDADTTPVASKEVSPSVSVGSTTTKKKIVKRKKSATPKKKDSSESPKTGTKTNGKTSAKTKIPTKKTAASPQTSQLKVSVPMSASGSPRNTPSQRPPDLMKLFYTTPPILLTATPRDLRKVRRAKVKRKKPPTRTPSLSSDSTGSTRSTATTSTEEGSNCEEDAEHKRKASTRSNDSGFDGSPRLSNCDMVCHKKCEKLTGNLCGLNQKLVAEALQALKKAPSQSSDNQRNADGDHYHHSGRVTPPATNLPRFKKYEVTDFNFLKVLGKGSFGKVLLAELRGTECVYAVKCLKKDVVLEDDDVECTLIERKVLTLATRHPYLCHLFCTFQTESHLFFVMEYLNGGDLMFHIQKSGRFSEQRAKFYAAEIWSGLIFLHKKGIVYRDLKLDNVLLDFEGHIRIADFGMCKLQIFLDRTADTFCGTPDYMAPEIIKGLKYNQAVDWWSYGVLLYEMLTGQSPFSGCDEDELFWSICNERPFIPRYLSQSSTDILVCLLEKDAGKRIPGHEIACHPFFCTIAWDKLERRSLEAPFKPAVEHTLDTRYFDTAFTTERPRLTPVPDQILTSMDQAVFRGFSYTNPNATD